MLLISDLIAYTHVFKGSPARIGPNLLLTDDPTLMRAMSAPRSNFTRGAWYSGARLNPRQDSSFSTRSEEIHNDVRAKIVHGVRLRGTSSNYC